MSSTEENIQAENASQVAPVPASTQQAAFLPVLLLDATLEWGAPQQQALALALAMRELGFTPYMACPPASILARKAAEHTLACIPLQWPTPGLRSLLRLWMVQQKAKPLCVHTFSDSCMPLAARLARLRRAGSTVLFHSCFTAPDAPTLSPVWSAMEKIICAHAVLRNQLADANINPACLAVVHPGDEVEHLPMQCEREDGRFVFLAQEALVAGSGVEVLIKAMGALWQRDDLPPWEVRVMGSGPCFSQLLDEAHALGVASRLALLGDQPLAEVLPKADVMVAPSTLASGHIAALMAAWCVGLPLICSQVPAHMEVVRPGNNAAPLPLGANALTVPPGDPQALAAAMIRLMGDGMLRTQLAERGGQMRSYTGFGRMVSQYMSLYKDCVARRGWILPVAAHSE